MIRILSLLFCLIYPLAVVGSNCRLWPEDYIIINQAIRHFTIAIIAFFSFLLHKKCFKSASIFSAMRWICLGSTISIILILTKLTTGLDPSLTLIYSSIEPVLVIGATAAISKSFLEDKHVLILITSFFISLLIFTFLNYAEGLDFISLQYNRPRLTFGFIHPGKLAQQFTILVLLISFCMNKYTSLKHKIFKLTFLLLFSTIIILTNTRAMIIVLILTAIFKSISSFNKNDAKSLTISLCLFSIPMILFTFLLLKKDVIHYILSGRINWWATALATNVQEFGWSMFIWGCTGDPIPVISPSPLEYDETSILHAFRVDNGFLEILIYHGIPVLVCYVIAITKFLKYSNFKKNELIALITIFFFFVSGESGFLAVGNSFGIILLIMIVSILNLFNTTNIHNYHKLSL